MANTKYPNPKTFFNLIFNWWTVPILLRGRRHALKTTDFPPVPEEHSALAVGNALKLCWEQEKKRLKPKLWRAVFRWLGRRCVTTCLLLAFQLCVLRLAMPLLIGNLIGCTTTFPIEQKNIYKDVILFILATTFSTFFYHYYFFASQRIGMDIRIALSSLIHDKILVLRAHTISKEGIGQVLNIIANDLTRIDKVSYNVAYIITGPLVLLTMTRILWIYNGPSSLAGILLLIILISSQGFIGKKLGKVRGKVALATDKRIRALVEMIDGMLLIKMGTRESMYERKLGLLRRPFWLVFFAILGSAELRALSARNRLICFNFAIYNVVTRLSVLVTFLAVVFFGNELTAESIFVTLSLYNSFASSLAGNLPLGISAAAELSVALSRAQRILLLDEKSKPDFKPSVKSSISVVLKNVTASWEENKETLVEINLTAEKRNVIGIIGPVGAGKSSILQVIFGELKASNPESVRVNGSIAFAPQEPWLFPESIRNNILCGRTFEPRWYSQVIQACGLEPDLVKMQFSDETLVGDRGVTLSGGQQARVSLARAVYGNADIYLLDDPLSALDVRMARHIKENCIDGLLLNKCVILVTHQTHLLRRGVTALISIMNGRVVQQGSFNKVVRSAGLDDGTANIFSGPGALTLDDIEVEESEEAGTEILDNIRSRVPSNYGTIVDIPQKKVEIYRKGNTGWKFFFTYARIGNSVYFIIFTVLVSILTQVIMNGSDFWLKAWADSEKNFNTHKEYSATSFAYTIHLDSVYVYGGLVAALFVMAFVQVITIYHMVVSSSRVLHQKLLGAILKAPFQFFEDTKDLTLKLFTSDTGVTDDVFTMFTYCSSITFMQVLGAICLVVFLGNYLIIPVVIYILVLFWFAKIYIHPSATIKRMESLAYTPIVGQLSNIISGVSVIRSCASEEFFRCQFRRLQDQHTSIFYTSLAITRWLTFMVELMSDLVLCSVVIYFVFTSANSTTLGLAITEAIMLTTDGTLLFIFATFLTNNISSAERLIDYSNIEPEECAYKRQYQIAGLKPPWPSTGRIRFQDVCVAHKGGPTVLQGFTAQIEDGEKIGIIGRTGAGKTSLVLTLFRIINAKSGTIHIDGLDTQKLSIYHLRRNVSIIQQNPILMAGTLRQNLDPFDEYTDADIWDALETVQLNKKIREMGHGLQSQVSEGGSNFSQGERQLISLGRTILQRSKVLVLDEATANIDTVTDGIIQHILRERFKASTILTIAHRLETVMDANKILVLDAGRIKEFDSPSNLLLNKNSYLSRLVKKTGPDNAKKLGELAANFSVEQKI